MADDLDIMRIRAYAATPTLMPPTRYTGRESPATMNIELVRLTLVNGMEGTASFISGWAGMEGGSTVREIAEISSEFLGRSTRKRVALTQSLLAKAGAGPWEALSLLDCAMWDAYARTLGQPLWRLLGGYNDRIPAYASTAAHLTIQAYLDDAERFIAQGYGAVKFHMNTDPEFDLEMVETLASKYADRTVRFMIDLEQTYSFDEAVRLGRVLGKLPFDWMEAPLSDHDLNAYVELNKTVPIDILPAGNTRVGLANWEEGLKKQAWSRLRCDVSNAGGFTNVINAMQLARELGVPVELQSFGFQPGQCANLHLMLGLQGCTWFEHPAPHQPYDYATRNPLAVDSRGCMRTSDAPGLGLEMDWQAIEQDAFATFDSLG